MQKKTKLGIENYQQKNHFAYKLSYVWLIKLAADLLFFVIDQNF